MKRLWLAWVLLAFPAQAQQQSAIFYNRETIIIERAVAPPLPWQDPTAITAASGITFDIETRDAMSFYQQKDWFNLSTPRDDSGVLLLFTEPGYSPIIRSRQYAALDILFIDIEGKIFQIVPSIQLAQLNQQIVPSKPVLAFLFLRGGLCHELGIKPGDMIQHPAFSRAPLILSEPETEQSPQAEVQPQLILNDETQHDASRIVPKRQKQPTEAAPQSKIPVKK